MSSSIDKLMLGSCSILSFILFSCLVMFFLPARAVNLNFYQQIAVIMVFGFNISILLGWISYGVVCGFPLMLLSMIFLLPANLRIGTDCLAGLAVSFAVTSLIGYVHAEKRYEVEKLRLSRIERLQEKINLAANEMSVRTGETDALRRKFKRYAVLKNVAEDLSTTLSLEKIAAIIIGRSLKVIGKSDRCQLFLVDKEKQELALIASDMPEGVPRIKSKKGDAFDWRVFKERKSLFIEDIAKDFRFSHEKQEEGRHSFRSLIASPIMSRHTLIGVLRHDAAAKAAYTQDDLRLLDFVADLAAIAVENCSLFSKAQELAIKDGLTGLAVQRYFKERLSHEVKRSTRSGAIFSLLMADIDHFKEYNDQYGHISGDVVLKHLAKALTKMAGEGDLVSRYGGEEFTIILVGKGKREALAEAESIRKSIAQGSIVLRRQKLRLTISIGVATYPNDANLDEELIKKADTYLYEAKAKGRNKVCG